MIKRYSSSFLFVILLFAVIVSCQKQKSSGLSSIEADSLVIYHQAILDSVQQYWDEMMLEDDARLRNMHALANSLNESEELLSQHRALKNMRYTQENMQQADNIDRYDSANYAYSSILETYALEEGQEEQLLLMERITQGNNEIIMHRIHYDQAAENYNSFIREYQQEIASHHQQAENWKKVPLFSLSYE